jgi:hypothetical protein
MQCNLLRPAGYLLVVAFDVVFASCLVPLFAATYWHNISPNAGFLSCLSGGLTRVILEFTLPKVGIPPPAGLYSSLLHLSSFEVQSLTTQTNRVGDRCNSVAERPGRPQQRKRLPAAATRIHEPQPPPTLNWAPSYC